MSIPALLAQRCVKGNVDNPVASMRIDFQRERAGLSGIPSGYCFHLLEVDSKTKTTFLELKAYHAKDSFSAEERTRQ